MNKLLPCPICGKKPIIEMWSSGGLKYMCKCNNPDCNVPLDGYPTGRNPASVIEAWNRRAQQERSDT
jgi:ssDNA-binding Zn-finger/Zn-ribbon topoisomerase 1